MKRYLTVLTALALIFAISSCGKGKKKIQGTWKITKVVYSDCDDPDDNYTDTYSSSCTNSTSECNSWTYIFSDDDTYNATVTAVDPFFGLNFTTNLDGIYTYDGSTIEICQTGFNGCDIGDISIDGDVATFTGDDEGGCTVTMTMTKQ